MALSKKKPKMQKKVATPRKRRGTEDEQKARDRFTTLRSILRRAWSKFPARYEVKNKARRDSKSPSNKKIKYEYQCNVCKQWYQWLAKKAARKIGKVGLSIDHKIPCGSLLCEDDVKGFVLRLFCTADGLQVLCDTCHDRKSADERRKD